MLDGMPIPNLTFPGVERGDRETNWDLSCFLYEGGAKADTRAVARMISEGQLGSIVRDRVELVVKIHQVIESKLVAGGSAFTANNLIRFTREMFRWAERAGRPLDIGAVQTTFVEWSDYLVHRQQVIKDLSPRSAYTIGAQAGYVLDAVLDRSVPLISLTRLRMPPQRKTARGVKAEKQNLTDTFAFGHLLQDTCDTLTIDTVLKGPLPVRIPVRGGGEIIEWSSFAFWKALDEKRAIPESHKKALARLRTYESDGTLRTRFPLANRRIEAELLMFIGQTGMNFAQAHKLKLRNFYYASHIDGYIVRDRKARRGGEVLFEVFKEYKPHFERYLDWRRSLFPDSDALFPFVRRGGRVFQKHPQFRLRQVCKEIGMRFVPPQSLRNTRVNWLLRRTGDADLTAAMAQHSKETLLRTYERPSQQRAMTEITRFWAKHDPSAAQTTPPAPGECNGKPTPLSLLPQNAAEPDCIRPSGCLWCEHHRDVDSLDYLWALASFRHLKIIEVSKWHPPRRTREVHPAQHAIDRISDKLRWFRDSNAKRNEWTEEALARVDEGTYHPQWARMIVAMEGSP